MQRIATPGVVLVLAALAAGCAATEPARYDAERYYRAIDADVERYVERLDRELRLDARQETRLREMLASRTRHLLDHTHPRDHARIYPFPRDGRATRLTRRWWRDADRHIGRLLSPRQADNYYDLVHERRRRG